MYLHICALKFTLTAHVRLAKLQVSIVMQLNFRTQRLSAFNCDFL